MTLSAPQRKALLAIRRLGRCTPFLADASVNTWKALSRRKLITVDTTFDSIALPRTAAWATVTKAGLAVLKRPQE